MAGHDRRIPRYESVALEIAEQIAKGIYSQGSRLHGRSTLASLYKVSPETIRKAMAILEEHGIVEVIHGSGNRVVSIDKAAEYLSTNNSMRDMHQMISKMRELMGKQRALMDEMNDLLEEIAALTRRD